MGGDTHWLGCSSSMEISTPFSWRRDAVYFCDTCLLFLALLSPGFFDSLQGETERRVRQCCRAGWETSVVAFTLKFFFCCTTGEELDEFHHLIIFILFICFLQCNVLITMNCFSRYTNQSILRQQISPHGLAVLAQLYLKS